MTPAKCSRWLDTSAKPSRSVLAKSAGTGELRRIVEVAGRPENLKVAVTGLWQEQTAGRRWLTLTERRTYADVSTFGRRYQPLEEQ